jgi:phospholipid/cholesterol/gamma-HCH transport system substrate-binding protein
VSRSLSRYQAVILGLVVLAGIAAGGWAVFKIGGRQGLFAETFELRAGFAEANGIGPGTPVRVRGIEAGQVVAVDLPPADDPQGKVHVQLRIDKKFQSRIPTDSQVQVLNEGMLGGKVISIVPGKEPTRFSDGDEIAVAQTRDLGDLMTEAGQTLREIRDSQGTLGKLLKSDEAHKEVLKLVQDTQQMVKKGQDTFDQGQQVLKEGKEALAALKQDAEAIKKLPLIRGYVTEDANALLYRPDQNSDRRIYAAMHLFEPGTATLSDMGRAHLSGLAPWFEAGKVKGSELVVVTYADPTSTELPSAAAQTLTLRRSEAVVNFLHDTMKAHKTGWWSSRKMTALGMGQNPPPLPEHEPMVPDRTEIFVFSPR